MVRRWLTVARGSVVVNKGLVKLYGKQGLGRNQMLDEMTVLGFAKMRERDTKVAKAGGEVLLRPVTRFCEC
ncbi:hypothetical protein U1Q18_047661 [Sarracenia purpurea var. burkii]